MVENLSKKNLSSRIFGKSRDFYVWKSKNAKTALLLAVDRMDRLKSNFFESSSVTSDLAWKMSRFSIRRLWDLIGLIEVSDYKQSKMPNNRQIVYENEALDEHKTKMVQSRSFKVTRGHVSPKRGHFRAKIKKNECRRMMYKMKL